MQAEALSVASFAWGVTIVPLNRAAWLLASLAATTSAHAGAVTPGGADAAMGEVLRPIAMLLAALLLLGGTLVVLSRRSQWRWGAAAIVGGCALLGGGALLDDVLAAIAVSS